MSEFDCIFVPHNSYHSREMLTVAKQLQNDGLNAGFICIDDHYEHNHLTKEILTEEGFVPIMYSKGVLGDVCTKALYVMNDWGGVVHELVKEANSRGVMTFGAIEGVNDFEDIGFNVDGEGRKRNPYKTVRHVFLTGEHDLSFFQNQQCHLAGIPRIDPLLAESPKFPTQDAILINCNFTYGIYAGQRYQWIEDVVVVAESLGLTYKISQHPSDDGNLSEYVVSENGFLADLRETTILVSRFSGCILESLALGKPCVYYDSFNEAVQKFKHPMEAYSRAQDRAELKIAIEKEISEKAQVVRKAKRFLATHLVLDATESSSSRIARQLASVIRDV